VEEGRAADLKLQEMANRLEVERAAKAAAIERLQEELDLLATASDKHHETLNKLTLASTEYQTFVEFSRWRIDAERAMALKRIYTSVRRAALEEAELNGYDVVLVNDSIGQIPPGDEMETMRQISARRMLYTNPALDVTQAIIVRLNAGSQATPRAP
jgi:Skp family chaperone for outer membrane proteins